MAVKTRSLNVGDTIGIFAPSWTGHIYFKEKFEFALQNLRTLGFNVSIGKLIASNAHQGYRTAHAKQRASEFMDLIENPKVTALVSTIGGSISIGLLEHLDFERIKASRKPIIGYSDVTSLLLGIYAKTGMHTFYGPALIPSFGEHPRPLLFTLDSFLDSLRNH